MAIPPTVAESARRFSLLACALGLLASSCGPSAPDFDETAMLHSAGFDKPLNINFGLVTSFGQPNGSAAYVGSDDAAVFALMVKAGKIHIYPMPERNPWWRFVLDKATESGGVFTVEAATRTIDDRKEQRRWSENSTDYYAETITYHLTLAAYLKPYLAPDIEQKEYSLRLVIQNRPEVGHWEMGPDTGSVSTERNDLNQAVITAGRTYLAEANGSVTNAKNEADQSIASDIAFSAGLERHGDTMVQRLQHRAFHVASNLGHQRITVAGAKRLCGNLRASGWSWHFPAASELNSIFVRRGRGYVVDSPRFALWRGMLAPDIAIATNTWSNGPGRHVDNPPGEAVAGVRGAYSYDLDLNGAFSAFENVADDVTKTFDDQRLTGMNRNLVIMCVAAIPA